MSKAYNIIEAVNMETGTKLKGVTPTGHEYECEIKNISDNKKICSNINPRGLELNDFVANTKFYKVPQPVTFKEALESGKKVKLDTNAIKIYSKTCCWEDLIRDYVTKFKNGEFLDVSSILLVIGWHAGIDELQHIFNDKCWYIEE